MEIWTNPDIPDIAQEHNITFLARDQTWTACSGDVTALTMRPPCLSQFIGDQ